MSATEKGNGNFDWNTKHEVSFNHLAPGGSKCLKSYWTWFKSPWIYAHTELHTMACKTNIHSKCDDLNGCSPIKCKRFYKRVAMRMDTTSDCDERNSEKRGNERMGGESGGRLKKERKEDGTYQQRRLCMSTGKNQWDAGRQRRTSMAMGKEKEKRKKKLKITATATRERRRKRCSKKSTHNKFQDKTTINATSKRRQAEKHAKDLPVIINNNKRHSEMVDANMNGQVGVAVLLLSALCKTTKTTHCCCCCYHVREHSSCNYVCRESRLQCSLICWSIRCAHVRHHKYYDRVNHIKMSRLFTINQYQICSITHGYTAQQVEINMFIQLCTKRLIISRVNYGRSSIIFSSC